MRAGYGRVIQDILVDRAFISITLEHQRIIVFSPIQTKAQLPFIPRVMNIDIFRCKGTTPFKTFGINTIGCILAQFTAVTNASIMLVIAGAGAYQTAVGIVGRFCDDVDYAVYRINAP